jgi:hypothetical protein
MRITLNLDDDVMEILRESSQRESISLGQAASELILKGAATRTPIRMVNGVAVFDIPLGGPKITSERVKELESEWE